jgi:hypothetical protein
MHSLLIAAAAKERRVRNKRAEEAPIRRKFLVESVYVQTELGRVHVKGILEYPELEEPKRHV